jgi:hypothetical protein
MRGRRLVAGVLGAVSASSAATVAMESPASAEVAAPAACNYAQVTHNYESRNDGTRTYWFPNTSWVSNCGVTIWQPPPEGEILNSGYARGYYRQSDGTWKFAERVVWVSYTVPRTTEWNLITGLNPGTRMNHGFSVRGQRSRNWY